MTKETDFLAANGWDVYTRADGTVYAQKQIGDNRIEQSGDDLETLTRRVAAWEAHQASRVVDEPDLDEAVAE